MERTKQEVLEKWLKVEYYATANKMELINKTYKPDYDLIAKTVRCIDYETSMKNNPDINYIITVIGLMWENINLKEFNIRPVIVKFLSRVGYPTSAIICDEGYDKEKGAFTKLDSIIDEITATLNQDRNEINVCGKNYLLTLYQKNIWDSLNKDKVIGISAPTSAGKSFVIVLKMVERLCKERIDVVYIVPTLSLLNQVTEDFSKELKKHDVLNCKIANNYDAEVVEEYNYIYVLTQEKAIAAFSESKQAFDRKLILVADEIQNIERIKEPEDERAKILFDVLAEFRDKKNVEQIIISGPRILDIDEVGRKIFGKKVVKHDTDISPVLNLTYSIKKLNDNYYLKQYCTLTEEPFVDIIDAPEIIRGYGQKIYNEEYLGYLRRIVKNVGDKSQNIIFAPTPKSAREIAKKLELRSVDNKSLIEYYKETVHENYSLCQTLLNGVAYHHGKMPLHVRRTLERAISLKQIPNVICTTTLLQGVNLPAQNIFIRNPHLYLKRRDYSAELTNYEMANLRGRAGRLLKDYVGRTFVLDEDEFVSTEGYEQMDLFDDVSKDLSASYEDSFEQYQGDIQDALEDNTIVDETMKNYGYLVSYIRQSVLRYGEGARKHMSKVGINLTKEQVAAIIYKMDSLSVPKEVCYKNRYWDPLILNDIYLNYEGEAPSFPSERGAIKKVDNMMKYLRESESTKTIYEKYIPSMYRAGQRRGELRRLAFEWAKEKKLRELLEIEWSIEEEEADKIERVIELIQNTVSYKLPLLLKPIFDIKNPESAFLTCLQAGANNIITRNLVELGIPRETAIYLKTNLFAETQNKDFEQKEKLCEVLRDNYERLPFWIQTQIEFLV